MAKLSWTHALLATLTAALTLLSACTLERPQVIYVTATPENTPTPSPEPSPTPIPTVPPTPTTPPETLLRSADRALLDGYYERAVELYRAVLGQGAPPDASAAAAFGLGQAALREGLFAQAAEGFTAFIESYPDDARRPQAFFLRGDAYLGLSRWDEAIADFRQYLTLRPGLIDSYAYERIGDAQLALGQTADALASYGQAVAASRTLVPQLALREKVAQVYLNAGQAAEAVAQYDAILEAARNAPYRASIEFAAAQAELSAADPVPGLDRLQRIVEAYPSAPQAYRALAILRENGREVDGYTVGLVSYLYGDYEAAIEAFNAWSTTRQLAAIPAEMHLLLGRAYRELGNAAAAVTAFQTVIDQYPRDTAFGEALLEQGRTRFLLGDIPGAIERYLFIADNYGYLPETAAEALWRAGYLYGTNDDPLQARQVFERLANAYPDTPQARSGLFIAASAAYSLEDYARAEQLFARLAATATGSDQASAYLWVGRLALRRGDNATAQQALNLAVSAAPESYFAARARDLITDTPPFAPPAAYRFQFDDVAELAAAENWLRQTFDVEQDGPLWPLSPALEADPRLVRGRELWAVGAYAEAENEFNDLLQAYRTDGLASYQLSIFLRAIAAYRLSIAGAANLIQAAGAATLDTPSWIARLRYPVYYRDVVLDAAERYNLDPLLLFSLIRLESLFDTTATAAAGEKGLTQVIPSTAEYIASQLQWPNYQHSDLFRPYVGVEFGAFYLAEQMRRFGGSAIAALASYNAGPGRAASWLQLAGGDPDLFMSVITIESTRGYVERLYSFYTIYRALYGSA
ncbi:MAG: lytic transglycosylase domain-containing protein [Aggregatilineales bacterium]